MHTFSDYDISQEIYRSATTLVYRGRRRRDGQPVILKMLNQADPTAERLARFRREYEIIRTLHVPGIAAVYSLEHTPPYWVIVLEDCGESLNRLRLAGTLPLVEVLQIGVQVAETLAHLQQQQIIHKDITPANLILNPTTGQIRLIDFGIATVFSHENTAFHNPNVLEGTLAYMSPEQTGRMNRLMDYRTDFYALGVTLYELLTGSLPFPVTDALDLIHSHLAKPPVAPHELRPGIPPPVSDLVLKLMAKNAEERYQSAYGIKADLEACLRQLRTTGWVIPFQLGQQDVPGRFQLPQKLYGRERERETLLAAFERASRGAGELLLVMGSPGIGKSALIQELYPSITHKRGAFIAGKFDQMQRNIPYAALIQAFRSLIRQLLAGGTNEIAAWRERLISTCAPNLQVIIEVVPEVELIVGPQSEVPALEPAEAQHRFNRVFEQFITVFTRPEHPLVIFLDDIQWADGASLQLMEQLMSAIAGHYLLVIGAYRDNEVEAGHPLRLVLEVLTHTATPIRTLTLAPLGVPAIARLVAETLYCPPEQAERLAELVATKTNGNPFFVKEFLNSLHTDGLITFDYTYGEWQWDLERIRIESATTNVIDLLATRVQRLTSPTRTLLQLAACMGNEFDLMTLSLAANQPPETIAHDLTSAVDQELIVPLGENYQIIALDTFRLEDGLTIEYRFTHDRIQQAVYDSIPPAERPALHWQIGQRLWQASTAAEREARLFVLVNQLGLGWNNIPDQATKDAVAELHLLAGRKARAAAAYEPACRYFHTGVALLDGSAWERNYDLARDLYTAATEAARLTGDFAEMERLAAIVIEHARTLLDLVSVYEVRIQAYGVQNRLIDAVQTALFILGRLGITFPAQPGPADRQQAIAAILAALERNSIEDLLALPVMTDPNACAAMRILSGVAAAAYDGMPDMFIQFVAHQVMLSITYGNAPESAFAYATCGMVLCGTTGKIDAGYQFGQLALRLVEQPLARRFKGRTCQVVHGFISHWKEPVSSVLPLLRGDYHAEIEHGGVEFSAYALAVWSYGAFISGTNLERLEREMAVSRDAIAHLKQTTALHYHEIFRQTVMNLRGKTDEPWQLNGPIYDRGEMLPRHQAANDRPALFFSNLLPLMLCYMWQQYDRALEYAQFARVYLNGATAAIPLPLFYLFDSLVRLALARSAEHPSTAAILDPVPANQKQLQQWATHAPANHLHRWHLVEAERSRIRGDHGAAREHYDEAITLARENGYRNDEALACELAAQFYITKRLTRLAQFYLKDAYVAWQACGARAKVQELTAHYPYLLAPEPGETAHVLDVTSVFRASHAIASEIVLDRLLTTIMHIVIENAGAQRGALIRGQPGQWVIEAQGGPSSTDITLRPARAVTFAELPVNILNYVAHTQLHVVLDDAARDSQFANDDYIVTERPRSLLCAPLMRQGVVIGLLYLENNLTTGVFTPDRVEIVSLLAGQVAISIENAALYSQLEDLVATRTIELTSAYERLKALNDQLQTELQLARQIQQHLLLPPRPDWNGLDVVCSSTPAHEVGGDLYMYHAFAPTNSLDPTRRYALAVGDVSGKGMPAALLMAISLGLFQVVIQQGLAPGALMTRLDQALLPYTHTIRQNCALVYVEIIQHIANSLSSSAWEHSYRLRVANAGGVTPLIKRHGGNIEWVEVGGLPLGVNMAVKQDYAEAIIDVGPGDMVILVSDGVIEASNSNGELFGFPRFEQTVRNGPQTSAEAMLNHLLAVVTTFSGAAEPHDDMTLVILQPRFEGRRSDSSSLEGGTEHYDVVFNQV